MANSFVTYTANGSTQQFDITFDYIDRTHINVYVDNVEDTTFTFINDSRIQTTSTPANAAVVKIERNTPLDARLVDFQDGSVLTEADLDRSANQNFFIAQETEDEVATKLGQNNAGVFDALNKRIINVAEPTASSDAATKNYIDTQTVSAAFTSATNAANSATAAASSASAASTSETNAATSETNAATSETNASTSETNAASSATAADASATAAAASETAAASSETAAASSETNAATSETNAATSASTASTQASNASTSATNAATSETNASNSATAAATSASNAATSESNASTSETNAASSASAASSSATSASNSASTATTQASNASTSASNAATSASNASTSESNAATSESNASTYASNASTAQSAAEAARDAALAAADNFDDTYLGAKASDPTVDNDGDPLTVGDWYFNTTSNKTFIYNGSSWDAIAPDLIGDATPQLGGDLDTNGNDINFGDNDKAVFGAGSDLQIYHDSSHSHILMTLELAIYLLEQMIMF
jgi:hypothetical protein